MLEPDRLRKVSVVHEMLDGSVFEQIRGFNKIIEPRISPNTTPAQRRFLANWITSDDKIIAYGIGSSNVYISQVIHDKDLVSDWLDDCEYGREFNLELVDTHLYTQWDDGTLEDNVIIKHDILLIGTSASPETFTTGSDKLTLDDAGKAFPSFNDTAYSYGIIAMMANGSQATMHSTKPTVSAGNLTFDMFYGDSYTPALDGNMYVSIYILQESKL